MGEFSSDYNFLIMNGNIAQGDQSPKAESFDPEIDRIAVQIKEANAKKMVQLKNTVVLNNIQKKISSTNIGKANGETSPDWSSVQGQFGWHNIGNELLPYIMRSGEKFIAERMTRVKLFSQYLIFFTNEIWEYFPIKTMAATQAEANLLNDINETHCDFLYGREKFTEKDRIYRLSDAEECYKCLSFCYNKLTHREWTENQKCGFIKIKMDNISFVPYVIVQDKQFVPLFYFDGDSEFLEKNAVELKGWDLVYLKFACKIQGIRRPLFDKVSIEVLELEYVKKLFSPGTEFESCWEIENSKIDLLRPADEANKLFVQYYKSPAQQPTKKFAPKMPTVRTKTTTHYPSPYDKHHTQSLNGCHNVMTNAIVPQQRQRFPATYVRPPIPRPQQNGYPVYNNNVPQRTTVAPYPAADPAIPQNVSNSSYLHRCSKYYQIPDNDVSNSAQYYLTSRVVEGEILVGCVSINPFNTSNLLVPLEVVSKSLFKVNLEQFKRVISVMGVDIYLPNKDQREKLHTLKLGNTEGLMQLNSLIEHLPQIKYMLGSR